jgi:hypothetical protein
METGNSSAIAGRSNISKISETLIGSTIRAALNTPYDYYYWPLPNNRRFGGGEVCSSAGLAINHVWKYQHPAVQTWGKARNTNMGRALAASPDWFSKPTQLLPEGLIGPVEVRVYSE